MVADGEEYGADEADDDEDDEAEGAEGPSETNGEAMAEDSEMAGHDTSAVIAAGDSDDGSEDIEGESSGSDDEPDEEEEGDGDEAMEVDDAEKPAGDSNAPAEHQMDEVMVH
jgi:histone chaperone ASF1